MKGTASPLPFPVSGLQQPLLPSFAFDYGALPQAELCRAPGVILQERLLSQIVLYFLKLPHTRARTHTHKIIFIATS